MDVMNEASCLPVSPVGSASGGRILRRASQVKKVLAWPGSGRGHRLGKAVSRKIPGRRLRTSIGFHG